jgi:hypothetical protein
MPQFASPAFFLHPSALTSKLDPLLNAKASTLRWPLLPDFDLNYLCKSIYYKQRVKQDFGIVLRFPTTPGQGRAGFVFPFSQANKFDSLPKKQKRVHQLLLIHPL